MGPKFSIIIPVYNVEKYLGTAIESVLGQTCQDFEILLVDDEGTDHSVQIAEEYVKKDERIHLYHHPHGGLPSARNVGLCHAKGEYIVLLDGDDFFALDHLQKVQEKIDLYHPDMCISNNITRYWENRTEAAELFLYQEQLNEWSVKEQIAYICNANYQLPASAVLTVYRKEYLKEHHFMYDESLCCSEDMDFFLQGLSKVHKICFTNHEYYYYRQDNTSAMTKNMTDEMYLARLCITKKWFDYYENQICVKCKKEFTDNVFQLMREHRNLKWSKAVGDFLKASQYMWGVGINCYGLNLLIREVQLYWSKLKGKLKHE